MGIFERFEKKVEGAVSGAFARAFKGDVQPVEIAARLQRELDAEAKLVSREKRLVPNEFAVGLSEHDHDKLTPYGDVLSTELGDELRSHARERGYTFNGPIRIEFDLDSSLPTGRFTVSSAAVAGVASAVEEPPAHRPQARTDPARRPTAPRTPPAASDPGAPPTREDEHGLYRPDARPSFAPPAVLVLEVNGIRHPLRAPGLTIGRGTDADLRINDPGISRLHAEIRVGETGPGQIDIVDLGSTNGIVVNGQKVRQAALHEGSRIEIGSTRMLVHAPTGR